MSHCKRDNSHGTLTSLGRSIFKISISRKKITGQSKSTLKSVLQLTGRLKIVGPEPKRSISHSSAASAKLIIRLNSPGAIKSKLFLSNDKSSVTYGRIANWLHKPSIVSAPNNLTKSVSLILLIGDTRNRSNEARNS